MQVMSVEHKALTINLDPPVYGTLAEIGAGQEVARNLFVAGAASGTIAKSMSAYDMQVSDAIYGKENSKRYVCESRLMKMLDHEYQLIIDRLTDRASSSTFFAFADTVAASAYGSGKPGHGWIGIRFQRQPGGTFNDIVIHIKMHDPNAQLQAQAIGKLGVSLIYGATQQLNAEVLVDQLLDEVGKKRLEIDVIKFSGPDYKAVDNRLIALKLVEEGFTDASLFMPDGEILQIADFMYKKPVMVQRGSFEPVTNIHWDLQSSGLEHFEKEIPEKKDDILVLLEMTVHNLTGEEKVDRKNFLDRVEAIAQLNQPVLISNFFLFYQLREFLQNYTNQPIRMVLGASLLGKLFEREHYNDLTGGILQGFGCLVKGDTKLYIYPQKRNNELMTSENSSPEGDLALLYDYIKKRGKFVDLTGCNLDQESPKSSEIIEMIQNNNPSWEKYVPAEVTKAIKEKKLFGFNA
ncbi:MAG: hypothetical protein AB8E15_07810 [Bdellovibrionales bacterium]